MKLQSLFIAGLLALSSHTIANAQRRTDEKYLGNTGPITMSANDMYDKAGSFKRLIFGEHYRKVWATQVELPVLYLEAVHGGLRPVRVGGGKQTKSLRLVSADGSEYVLRSVNKDPSKAIPREFVGTFADDVVQDQISSSNPYAPMVVAELADAARIYHTTPALYYVPDQAALGSYKDDFANTLCLLEERPDGNQKKNKSLDYPDKVVNSRQLFEKVFDDTRHRVDEHAFLRARLFDIWIGDWDRHEDQWTWAAFKKDGRTIYKPIPRDRDQAFSSLDGIVPTMASRKWSVRKTQNFDYRLKDVVGLAMSGIVLDRSFTTSLSSADWQDAAAQLQLLLTDDAIEQAFRKMPAAIYALTARETIDKLKRRRADLPKYADIYYRFLSEKVSIVGTEGVDYFDISRAGKSGTRIVVRSGRGADKVIFDRTFLNSETREIRLYGLSGDDRFDFGGAGSRKIRVKVIGGKDRDTVNAASGTGAWRGKAKIYDDEESLVHARSLRYYRTTDSLKNEYSRASHIYAYDWLAPQVAPGYNPDDGFYIGGGIVFKKQGFGKSPYACMHSVRANYAVATGAYNFWYEGIFKEVIGSWDLKLNAAVNAPNYTFNYFGAGNETELYRDDKNYNRIRSNRVSLTPSLARQIGTHHSIDIGITGQSVKVERTEDRFVADARSKLDSGVFGTKNFIGPKLAYQFNAVDSSLYPRSGVRLNAAISSTHGIDDSLTSFATVSSDLSYYHSFGPVTVVLRVGAASNLGDDYQFYQYNTLGGTTNLRGYRRDRFAGKTTLYQNTELRWKLSTVNGYILRGSCGLLGFLDNGRVWIPGEHSSKWHMGYGAGIWFLPYNKIAFTASYGISDEAGILSVKAGFLF